MSRLPLSSVSPPFRYKLAPFWTMTLDPLVRCSTSCDQQIFPRRKITAMKYFFTTGVLNKNFIICFFRLIAELLSTSSPTAVSIDRSFYFDHRSFAVVPAQPLPMAPQNLNIAIHTHRCCCWAHQCR